MGTRQRDNEQQAQEGCWKASGRGDTRGDFGEEAKMRSRVLVGTQGRRNCVYKGINM